MGIDDHLNKLEKIIDSCKFLLEESPSPLDVITAEARHFVELSLDYGKILQTGHYWDDHGQIKPEFKEEYDSLKKKKEEAFDRDKYKSFLWKMNCFHEAARTLGQDVILDNFISQYLTMVGLYTGSAESMCSVYSAEDLEDAVKSKARVQFSFYRDHFVNLLNASKEIIEGYKQMHTVEGNVLDLNQELKRVLDKLTLDKEEQKENNKKLDEISRAKIFIYGLSRQYHQSEIESIH